MRTLLFVFMGMAAFVLAILNGVTMAAVVVRGLGRCKKKKP
jgi:hypothetical protein